MDASRKGPDPPPDRASGTRAVCPLCNATFPGETLVCPQDGTGLLEIPDAPLLTGSVLDDRYDMGGVVGAGGMGIVYRAHQRAMERDVAVKVLHPHYAHDPRAVKRFFREAQASSRLIHPHVVTVYDFGRSREGHLYMVMELLEGWTLGDLIYHRAPLTAPTAVRLAVQICEALDAAHQRRVVHRDLKPDNVQLISRDGQVFAKVLDFGIARVMRDPDADLGVHLSTVDIAGTPAYMSPEQIMGRDPDPRSDLYALGVMLYEMLTGERPFDDENSVTLCMRQLNERPSPMASHVGDGVVPEDVEAVVQSLLAKDVESRPDSAKVVRDRLLATESGKASLSVRSLAERSVSRRVSGLPTRPDAGAMMALPTMEVADQAHAAQAGPGSTSLGGVIDAVRTGPPAELSGSGAAPCPICKTPDVAPDAACRRCGHVRRAVAEGRAPQERPERAKVPAGAPAAMATLLVGREADFKGEALFAWLESCFHEGWHVQIRDAAATVRVPRRPGVGLIEAVRQLFESLEIIRSAALRANLALRIGLLAGTDEDERNLVDLASRLAVAAPYGDIAVPSALARELQLRGRPITSVFLPSGKALGCCAIANLEGQAERLVPLEFTGHNRSLRRLGQLADDARHEGAIRTLVVGDRGAGRTSLLRAFASGRNQLYLRVSAAAHAWPGFTAARIARACLGIRDDADAPVVRGRIEPLPLMLRDRLAVLLLDDADEHGVTAGGLAHALVEVLSWRAGEGAFTVLLDDAHLMDEASREILEATAVAAGERPWLFVASAPRHAVDERPVLFASAPGVDLRPLGLRAAAALLRAHSASGARRTQLLAAGQGNPLALQLLSECAEDAQVPRADAVVTTLLPNHLRGVAPDVAESAWMAAILGGPEAVDDMAIRAARLYLELGVPPNVGSWIASRLRGASGLHAELLSAFSPVRRPAGWRAARTERLGLWRLAAEEAEKAAESAPQEAGTLLLAAARLRALAGDVAEALVHFEDTLARGGGRADVGGLIRLGAVLLQTGEGVRAEPVLLRARAASTPDTSPVLHGELSALLARCAVRRNETHDAMAHLGCARETLTLLQPVDARAARALEALIQEVRAEVALAEGDAHGTRTNLRQARDAFRDLGLPADAIRCLVELGRVELDDGEPTRASETFRAAMSLAKSAGLQGELRRARVGLGEALVGLGDCEKGASVIRRVLREAGGICGDARAVGEAAVGLAFAMLALELPEDALRYAERALAGTPPPLVRARALYALSEARAASGQMRVAARTLAETRLAARAAGHGLLAARAEERLIDLEMQHGVTATPGRSALA
ncbi:MAG: protein kinase [Deltaproteobacteria bacterium]|nr:protein kinase [Deltaproteobacteria bacterium]MCB9786552.1 protein kinase [Deltaproteobacteria bacterium]